MEERVARVEMEARAVGMVAEATVAMADTGG